MTDLTNLVSHRQVTDRHLIEIAARHAGQLVTFDRTLGEVAPSHVQVLTNRQPG